MNHTDYCQRVGLPSMPPATVEGVAALQLAHRTAIAFENLDVLLGREIRLDRDWLFEKLVVRRRGGYCFEHNLLLSAVLENMGIANRPLLARVWLNAVGLPARTHLVLLAEIEGADWIVDAGFGGSYCPPLRLEQGTEARAPDGSRFVLDQDRDHGWMVQRSLNGTAARQFSFTLEPVGENDIALSNHWTATAATSRFRNHLIVNRLAEKGLISLFDRKFSHPDGGYGADTVHELGALLEQEFGIILSAPERNHLSRCGYARIETAC